MQQSSMKFLPSSISMYRGFGYCKKKMRKQRACCNRRIEHKNAIMIVVSQADSNRDRGGEAGASRAAPAHRADTAIGAHNRAPA